MVTKTKPVETEPEEQRSTRDEILDAAEQAFAERGFAGVSMRDIVRETNLKNQASLYNHFGSKQALYEAVLARGLAHIFALVPQKPPDSLNELNDNLDRLLNYLARHANLARLIQRAALDDARYLESTLTNLLSPFYSYGSAALAGISQTWERDQIPHLGAGLYMLIFGYFANAPLMGHMLHEDPLSPEAEEHQRRFVKEAVARLLGLKSTAQSSPQGGG
jgi:AcrR family transcriptional regulator